MAQDPWAVVSEKPATMRANKAASSDPWAVMSTNPDISSLTTNTKGEGLYQMYGSTGKGEEMGRIWVPYSKVPAALASGITWYTTSGRLGENPEGERYAKDKAFEGKTPSWWDRANAAVENFIQPLADVPLEWNEPGKERTAGSFARSLPAAAQNVEQMPWNAVVAGLRGIEGLTALPAQGWEMLKGVYEGNAHALEPLESLTAPGMAVNLYQAYQNDAQTLGPMAALSRLGGNLATLYAAGKVGGELYKGAPKSLPELREAAAERGRGAAKTMTGTGPRGIGKLARETQAENVAGAEKAAAATKEYNKGVGETIQANRRAAGGEAVRSQAAEDMQVKGSQLMTGIKALEKRVRATANGNYEAVKTKVGEDADPRGLLAGDVRAAQEKWIRGSPEKIKEFQAVLQPPKTTPAQLLADQTAENLGYKSFAEAIQNPQMRETLSRALPPEVFEEAASGEGGTLSWNDYQGFYEETGAKLAPGDLPPDIYKAVQEVHEKTGKRMEEMARRHDALPEWYDAKNYYRQFMETFHDATGPSGSASPVAQAFLAKDPATAAEYFLGNAGDRAVVELSRYDPRLTQLAQDLRQSREAARVAPKGAHKELPPPPESTKFTPRTLTPEDIRARHRADLQASADLIANLGRRRMDWSLFTGAAGLITGILGQFRGAWIVELAGGGALASPFVSEGLANFMERPGVIARLERITPADIDKVPPELRSQALNDLRPLLIAARGRGAKINPAVWALAVSAAGTALPSQKKSLKELRGEAEKNKPPQAAAPAGPQSMARPYTHIFDEERGMIVPA